MCSYCTRTLLGLYLNDRGQSSAQRGRILQPAFFAAVQTMFFVGKMQQMKVYVHGLQVSNLYNVYAFIAYCKSTLDFSQRPSY